MAKEFVNGKMVTGGCSFSRCFISVVTFTFCSLCLLLLIGCNGEETGVTGTDRFRNIPLDARKAEVSKELDRKFENPQAHFELGQIYRSEGLVQKAEYHYHVAMSFDPSHVDAQAAMVKLFFDGGNTAKGKNYADVYIKDVSGSTTQLLRLATAFQKEQLDEYALACYQQAIRLAPNSAAVNKEFAFYYLGKNDNAQAKEYFVRSFQLDPRQPDVANELGRLGVEVRIPREPEEVIVAASEQADQDDEREWRIVPKHGLIQVEPIIQKGEKKNK